MSTTDPDAALMRAKVGGPLQLGYQDTYVTDGGRERIIMNVLVTPGEVMENQVMLDVLWNTCFRWKLWPDLVAADTTYGTIETIIPIENAGISMYTPCQIGTTAPSTSVPPASNTIRRPTPVAVRMARRCDARRPSTPRARSSLFGSMTDVGERPREAVDNRDDRGR